ncbi:MAG: hypothetical protein AB7N91_32095 [Candidatus Tectimicrobiota bacterium]
MALRHRTQACSTPAAHPQALESFLAELTPGIRAADLPTLGGPPGSLFDHLACTPNGDGDEADIWVALSPLGEVACHAWLRQRGLDPLLGRS